MSDITRYVVFWSLTGSSVMASLWAVRQALNGLESYRVSGWFAVAALLGGSGCVLHGFQILAYVQAVSGAMNAYHWWNGGGDDDTKRRLRKLSRAFTGTRRTAPGAAS